MVLLSMVIILLAAFEQYLQMAFLRKGPLSGLIQTQMYLKVDGGLGFYCVI